MPKNVTKEVLTTVTPRDQYVDTVLNVLQSIGYLPDRDRQRLQKITNEVTKFSIDYEKRFQRAQEPVPQRGKPPKRQNAVKRQRRESPPLFCPHCNATGGAMVMHRWHFDNCKKRKDWPDAH